MYGNKLNPNRRLKTPRGIKGIRQSVVLTNNPSTISENETLTIRFPNLGSSDVIVPGTTRLSFNIELSSDDDANRTIVMNVGRALINKIAIKFEGQEVSCLHLSLIHI